MQGPTRAIKERHTTPVREQLHRHGTTGMGKKEQNGALRKVTVQVPGEVALVTRKVRFLLVLTAMGMRDRRMLRVKSERTDWPTANRFMLTIRMLMLLKVNPRPGISTV